MLYWLIAAILAYVFFGFASLGDKLMLNGKTATAPKPKSYTFYVGIFSLFVIVIIPFIQFTIPSATGFFWLLADAIAHIVAMYAMYVAIAKFDISKVIATIGATQPIFIFVFTYIFWGPQTMSPTAIIAFVLLFLGSVIISIEKTIKITADYLKITIFSSLMFALDYIFMKRAFTQVPFLSGIIWIQILISFCALFILFSKKARAEIFSKQMVEDRKNQIIFLFAQLSGGLGNLTQAFAISLAPVIFLATINSLRGVQFVFLFFATIFISRFYPKILKEDLSKRIIYQKIFSIILIVGGLILLVA